MFRVGVIGPEATGKSSLSQYLAKRYGALCIPEYARDYVANLGRAYTYEDICIIARKQIEQLSHPLAFAQQVLTTDVVFYDTELIITKVWFDVVYHSVPQWLTEALLRYPMDCYLLTYPDLPWTPDPTRENGSDEVRQQLFLRYEQEIQALDIPYYIIKH